MSNANRGGHSRRGETRGGRRGRMRPPSRTMYEKYLDVHREFRMYLEENGPRPERVRQPRVEAPASPPSDDDFESTPEWVRQPRVEAPEQEPNPLSELFRPEPPPSDDGPSLRLGRGGMHLGGLLEITDWPKPYPKP